MTNTPTLNDLLSQSDDANVKRLILDAYKLGVKVGWRREIMMDAQTFSEFEIEGTFLEPHHAISSQIASYKRPLPDYILPVPPDSVEDDGA